MSDSEELKRVVEHLLRENNVKLKDLFQHVLPRIAGELWAARLIEKYIADSVRVQGVDHITLAAKLFDACYTSLLQYPAVKFPQFIEVLKGYETMKPLAEEMESEFEQARESYINALVAMHFASLFKRTCSKPEIALLCRFVNGNHMFVFTDDEREDYVASAAYLWTLHDVNICASPCLPTCRYIHKCAHNMHVFCSNGEFCPVLEPNAFLENCANWPYKISTFCVCIYVLFQSRTLSSSETSRPVHKPAVQLRNWKMIFLPE